MSEPQWHFKAVSPHIEVEEYVFTEKRLNTLTHLVRWAHSRYMIKNGLRIVTPTPATHFFDKKGRVLSIKRVENPILKVTITPINRAG